LTIVSSGSEVSIAYEAASKLKAEGIKTRIVSLPCWLTFDQQDEAYRLSVLRSGAPILSLEALSVSFSCTNDHQYRSSDNFLQTLGWQKYSHEVFFNYYSVKIFSLTVMVAIWSGCVGFIWSLPEGVREIRHHWLKYIVLYY
jgi:transketolase